MSGACVSDEEASKHAEARTSSIVEGRRQCAALALATIAEQDDVTRTMQITTAIVLRSEEDTVLKGNKLTLSTLSLARTLRAHGSATREEDGERDGLFAHPFCLNDYRSLSEDRSSHLLC